MHRGRDATPGALPPRWPAATSAPSVRTADRLGAVVQQIVTRLLPDGPPNVHSVAELVRMSGRTLQRRLSRESLTFAGVVARARLDMAQRMLDDPGRRVIDVALELGYSDPAHFTRAFVRWTGVAPRQFRQRRATASSGVPGSRLPSCVGEAAPQPAERSCIAVAEQPRLVEGAARGRRRQVLANVLRSGGSRAGPQASARSARPARSP